MKNKINIANNACIVISGEAGQGIETIELFLAKCFKNSGYYTFSTKEYMSRIRGGCNSSEIRVASGPVSAYLERIDILIALHNKAIEHNKKRISNDTIIFSMEDNFYQYLIKEAGGKLYANTISAGIIAGMFSLEFSVVEAQIRDLFSSKTEDVINTNIKAAKLGYDYAQEYLKNNSYEINISPGLGNKDNRLISGTEAVAIGCVAGGCNFISSYPMSPGTGVLTYLTKKSEEFGIISEQAEDEIAAINMSIAASYAGARGMVTTSGGGFALMKEGISLAGMIETPVVVHLAQRPGPATGLPTRTEQGDLNLALYAGHGEFPRIILAPGDPQEAFEVSYKAFNLADKFQSPIFILTDQYLLDSLFSIEGLDIDNSEIENHFIRTEEGYVRYKLTENGISPRGIPGYGEGLVLADSDEHTEEGHITEDLDLRVKMVDKRLKKLDLMLEEAIEPELTGIEDYKTLVITWGSTKHAVQEGLKTINNNEIAHLHFRQVYPVHKSVKNFLEKAKKTVIVENNATSQFGNLLKHETGMEIAHKVLKYNGLPFSVEEIVNELRKI